YPERPEETARVLRRHADGRTWLHTGDIGVMDGDGFFYFRLRRNRIIRSDGMNVYPVQVEEVLRSHPYVAQACVIGVPDKDRKERVKAFVVVKDSSEAGPELEKAIRKHCMENLLRWSCPRDIEFRQDLPRTLVGKVAFNVLMEEEKARLGSAGEYTGN
ncbi:long-chain fatty acid--CoA ligase, partial [bacterium]|nr:long-chain fatty acid--CoA ligase [bacterium]